MGAPGICALGGQEYTVAVFRSSAEIRSLRPVIAQRMPENDVLRDPHFFLASVSNQWRPRAAYVCHGTELSGVVFAKERIIGGVPLGVLYSDLSFGSLLFENPIHQEKTFRIALESLLAIPGIRGVRLRVLRNGPELAAIRKLLASRRLDVYASRVRDHARLPLPGTYEEFLANLGYTTRRNFRYYRRRFETAGHVHLENLSLDELRSAASYLDSKSHIPKQPGSIERVTTMLAAADRPLAFGLKHRNGEWLSVLGGVMRQRAAVLLLQLNNDRNFPRDSLSVVQRAYFIEWLIRHGIEELIVWAGTAPPLSRYVTYIPTLEIHLDSPAFWWRLMRALVSVIGPWLPRHLRPDARWIAPFR